MIRFVIDITTNPGENNFAFVSWLWYFLLGLAAITISSQNPLSSPKTFLSKKGVSFDLPFRSAFALNIVQLHILIEQYQNVPGHTKAWPDTRWTIPCKYSHCCGRGGMSLAKFVPQSCSLLLCVYVEYACICIHLFVSLKLFLPNPPLTKRWRGLSHV